MTLSILFPIDHDRREQPAGAQFIEELPRAEQGQLVLPRGRRRADVERRRLAVATKRVRFLSLRAGVRNVLAVDEELYTTIRCPEPQEHFLALRHDRQLDAGPIPERTHVIVQS